MPELHVVIGGYKSNSDKDELLSCSKKKAKSEWTIPKTAEINDTIIIFINGYGLFASAIVCSTPKPAVDWKNSYWGSIKNISIIEPAISLEYLKIRIKNWKWLNYPRSYTTPPLKIAAKLRLLINERKNGNILVGDKNVEHLSIHELHEIALPYSTKKPKNRKIVTQVKDRSAVIKQFALKMANGFCRGCNNDAPFIKEDGHPYLEVHHPKSLSNHGIDHPDNVIALCPNCHRKAHSGIDKVDFNKKLIIEISNRKKEI